MMLFADPEHTYMQSVCFSMLPVWEGQFFLLEVRLRCRTTRSGIAYCHCHLPRFKIPHTASGNVDGGELRLIRPLLQALNT